MRVRARFLAQLRELQLRDIGGFLLEQHRAGRTRPDLVELKLRAAAETDTELRSLRAALKDGRPMHELRAAGIGGSCAHCGTVHGSSDRFCSWCGRRL